MRYTKEQKEGLTALQDKIKEVKIAMLTTMDYARGSLHSRPMATIPSEEGEEDTLWFFTYSNSEKANEIKHKSAVNLNYAEKGDDLYVSVSGDAEIVDDLDLIKKKWNPLFQAWFPDGYNNPNVCLMKVHVTEAEFWDSNASKMTKLFEMVKGLVTGERADMHAEHEKINFRKQ